MEIFELEPLFGDVQLQKIFADGKTFADCIPLHDAAAINEKYIELKDRPGFSLPAFVKENFEIPVSAANSFEADISLPVEQHIEKLWTVLTRNPDKESSSLIPLPYPYIVPGGRFREIYYWDSYFSMLGLQVSGRVDMIENMINNFSHLIGLLGHIPNGNRSYYISRSQPPFYSLMIKLLSEMKGEEVLKKSLPGLQKEYDYWMMGNEEISETNPAVRKILRLEDGTVLNRYWDEADTPRPESYKEDVELAHGSADPAALYRHLRAAAESGWDFSARWFRDTADFGSIHTCAIVPVDLNCLLYHLELTLSVAYHLSADREKADFYKEQAELRKRAIRKYCWSETLNAYVDYDFQEGRQKNMITLASSFPLYFNIADREQANAIAAVLKDKFLQEGGLVTTLINSGQQWDYPNGWAPLQWISIIGLENYGQHELAKEIADRWIRLNRDVFTRTGKLMEKYNVADTHLEAGGGEYPGQDGFGWTNGVLLALIKKYG